MTNAYEAGLVMGMEKAAGPPLTAVIIMGNPKYVRGNKQADRFYKEIAEYLEGYGFTVSTDPGMPYTRPKRANIWIGHSRGADRLQFAQAGTKTVAIGSPMEGAINHPADDPKKDKAPGAEHYMLTPKMKLAIDKAVRMVGGSKVAYLAGTMDNTQREPTSGVARAIRETNTKKKAPGKVAVKPKKPSPGPEPGHRPQGPYTPGTPAERGDDTRQ